MIDIILPSLLYLALVAATYAVWHTFRNQDRWPRSGWTRLGLILLVITPMSLYGIWQLSRSRSFQILGEIVHRVGTASPVAALTFDDGPAPGPTAEILRILDSAGVKATFFVTGKELAAHPDEGRAIIQAGHELGNHSYSHPQMIAISLQRVREEIETTDSLIVAAGQTGPIYFRPPYSRKLLTLPYFLASTGRSSILFDVEPESDAGPHPDAEYLADRAIRQSRPGSIILMHVMYASRKESMRAVPMIISGLQRKGYRFATVTELLRSGR